MLGTRRDSEAEVPGNAQLIKVGIVVLLPTMKDIRVFPPYVLHAVIFPLVIYLQGIYH